MIISIANQKGGVGKTTTVINLAAACAMKGRRVLVVDLDPQGNSTQSFLDPRLIGSSAFELLTDPKESWEEFTYETDIKNLELVPARINLAKSETRLAGDFDAVFRLRDRLDAIRAKYDIVILDTPPSLGLITINALVASNHIIIPIQSSYFAMEGADDLLETIGKIRSRSNPDLNLLGVLVTLYDKRTILSRDVESHIRRVFGEKVFKTPITRTVRLEESPAHKQSIFTYAPRSSGAREYSKFCLEVLRRIGFTKRR